MNSRLTKKYVSFFVKIYIYTKCITQKNEQYLHKKENINKNKIKNSFLGSYTVQNHTQVTNLLKRFFLLLFFYSLYC